MKDVQRIAIVDPSDATREPIRNLLLSLDSIWLEAECSRYEFFPEVVQQSQPDLALVSMDADPDAAMSLITTLAAENPTLGVLAVSSRTDGPFILQTLRSGAREFLTQPLVLEELLTALQRVRSQSISSHEILGPGARADSMVLAIAGSRGGVGCTSVAVNLGCLLASEPENNVVLIDLDLALGDADVALDLMPSYTLADVAMNIDRLDMTFLRGSLVKHSTGLSLLPHPVQLEDMGMIQQEHLERVLGLLRATYTHVILDLSKSFQPTDFAAMKAADLILLIAQLDLTSVRNSVRLMMSMNSVEGMSEKVRIVLNRVGSSDEEITLKKAEETIGQPIFWELPNDSKAMLASRNAGIPVVEHMGRSKVANSFCGLCDALLGREPVEETNGAKGRKGFLFFRG